MKKVLMGTTALVAAGMMAGAAQAQEEMMEEPISLSLGGYYRAAIGSVSGNDGKTSDGKNQPEADRHTIGIAQDAEVRISGETTLDNGLTVGVRAHMEVVDGAGIGGANTVDEAWLYFKDDFGQLRLGSVESARQEMTNFAPNGASNFGVNTPFFTFANKSSLATHDDGIGNEDAAKLVYFSPTFNGFRLALSWAPDDDDGGHQYPEFWGDNRSSGEAAKKAGVKGNTLPGHSHTGEVGQQYQNHVAIGAEFSQSFMEGSSIRIAGGYETYEQEAPAATPCADKTDKNCEPSSLHLGATISFDQISFGGGWMKVERHDNQDKTIYDLGLSWSDGPMTAGLQWGHASTGNKNDKMTGMPQADTELNRYAVNGTLVLGPGIDLQAQLDFGENDAPGQHKDDNDWTQFMLGTAITF